MPLQHSPMREQDHSVLEPEIRKTDSILNPPSGTREPVNFKYMWSALLSEDKTLRNQLCVVGNQMRSLQRVEDDDVQKLQTATNVVRCLAEQVKGVLTSNSMDTNVEHPDSGKKDEYLRKLQTIERTIAQADKRVERETGEYTDLLDMGEDLANAKLSSSDGSSRTSLPYSVAEAGPTTVETQSKEGPTLSAVRPKTSVNLGTAVASVTEVEKSNSKDSSSREFGTMKGSQEPIENDISPRDPWKIVKLKLEKKRIETELKKALECIRSGKICSVESEESAEEISNVSKPIATVRDWQNKCVNFDNNPEVHFFESEESLASKPGGQAKYHQPDYRYSNEEYGNHFSRGNLLGSSGVLQEEAWSTEYGGIPDPPYQRCWRKEARYVPMDYNYGYSCRPKMETAHNFKNYSPTERTQQNNRPNSYSDGWTELECPKHHYDARNRYTQDKTYSPRFSTNRERYSAHRDLNCNDNESYMMESLAGITKRMLLPPCGPIKFSGRNIEDYMPFILSFEDTVVRHCSNAREKFRYLLAHTEGPAHTLVSSCFRHNPEESFDMAMLALKEEYGNIYLLAKHYIDVLRTWPRIKPDDGPAFKKLSLCLMTIRNLMGRGREFQQFNNAVEIKMVIDKLPVHLNYRWRDIAHKLRYQKGEVEFSDLADFVKEQSDIVNQPIFGVSSMNRPSKTDFGNSRRERVFLSNIVREGNTENLEDRASFDHRSLASFPDCVFCGKNKHDITICHKFRKLPHKDKSKFLFDQERCYRCLEKGHRLGDCNRKASCDICHSPVHVTSMHRNQSDQRKSRDRRYANPTSDDLKVMKVSSKKGILSPSVAARIKDSYGSLHKFGVALDSWAQATFISPHLRNKLGAVGRKKEISLTTMSISKPMIVEEIPLIELIAGSGSSHYVKNAIVIEPWPFTNADLPAANWRDRYPFLNFLPDINCSSIEMLLGNNEPDLVKPLEVVGGSEGEPYAVRYALGWAVCGPMNPVAALNISCFRTVIKEDIEQDLDRFYKQDFLDPSPTERALSLDDKRWYERVEGSIVRTPSLSYQIDLPFREPFNNMPYNFNQARGSMRNLARRFKREPVFATDYKEFMAKFISKGYLEKIPLAEIETDPGQVWYLVHHAVYHKTKKKIRVVFDCSRECAGTSLNSKLLQGPDLLNSLLGVLLRFREGSVAVMGDIEAMFMQIKVPKQHSDFMRVLWWPENNLDEEPAQYRLASHTFGAVSSPSVANYAVKRAVLDSEGIYAYGPLAKDTLSRCVYVDDVMRSVSSEEQGIGVLKAAQAILAEAGFNLTSMVSNSRAVLEQIPPDSLAKSFNSIDLNFDALPRDMVLGVVWEVETDCFTFRINMDSKPHTRRGMLAVVSSIFDPMGLVSPVIVPPRKLFQLSCKEKLDWDEDLPDHLLKPWQDFLSTIEMLSNFSLPRCFHQAVDEVDRLELHVFCDGSLTAYAAVAYCKIVTTSNVIRCSLILSKTRQTPISGTALRTIPRIELNAAKLAITVAQIVKQELDLKFNAEFFWTDSKTVLRYLRSESARLLRFVENRVSFFRSHSNITDWHYIPGKLNIADVASRGTTVEKFLQKGEWTDGPSFLHKIEEQTFEEPEGHEEPLELKALVTATEEPVDPTLLLLNSTDKWDKIRYRVAAFRRFFQGLYYKHSVPGSFSEQEIVAAEEAIFKYLQGASFPLQVKRLSEGKSVLKGDILYKYSPFLDDRGLMRVKGRLAYCEEPYGYKHPIILSGDSKVATVFVWHIHRSTGHMGKVYLRAILQEKFVILRLNKLAKTIANSCLICRKVNSRPVTPEMANLPSCRVIPQQKAFYTTGLDFFGPLGIVSPTGRPTRKGFGLIFTCLASRAIHIELVERMDAHSFINALRRFMARRGEVRTIYSDNGSNIVGGVNQLKHSLDELSKTDICSRMASQGIDWHFSPPRASNFGGIWEREIRTARKILWSLCMEHPKRLTTEVLTTLLCEVELIMNNRPITPVSAQSCELGPLTPNHLLMVKPLNEPSGAFTPDDEYGKSRWRYVQRLADIFWQRWRKEYVVNLRERHKWIAPRANPDVGDLVMLTDPMLPRNTWPLAVVHEVLPSNDGVVRKVVVRVVPGAITGGWGIAKGTSLIRRPVNKIVPVIKLGQEAN